MSTLATAVRFDDVTMWVDLADGGLAGLSAERGDMTAKRPVAA